MTDIFMKWNAEDAAQAKRLGDALAEIERLRAAIAHVRQRSAKASEILNEFDNTYRAPEPKP